MTTTTPTFDLPVTDKRVNDVLYRLRKTERNLIGGGELADLVTDALALIRDMRNEQKDLACHIAGLTAAFSEFTANRGARQC